MPQPLREIGFDQNIDQKLPLDAQFRDEDGKTVTLGSYYGKKPVLLAFVYYTCPMLCTQVLNAMTATVSTLSLDAGKDFELVLVSIDPRETPGAGRGEEGRVPAPVQAPGRRGGLALPDRRRARDQARHQGRGLPLRLGRTDAAVRASDRHHRDDHRRAAGALPVRYRVRSARPEARAGRRIGREGRERCRPAPPLLLSLRPDDRDGTAST